jgi:hypothetical protein
MTPGDEKAAKPEPTEGQSAGAAAGFNDQLEQLPATVSTSLQPDLHGSEDVRSLLSQHLDHESSERRAIYDRLQAIESAIKRRRSRGIVGYLVAMGIGVAATVAWQSYGETTKQIIATNAPELGWSPETKQTIASWMQQLGWTKQPASPASTAVRSSALESVPETPQPIPKPSPDQAAQNQPNNEQTISPNSLSQNEVRQVQQALEKNGVGAGAIDGRWGPKTTDAVKQFQQSKNIRANGQLDQQTLSDLGLKGVQFARTPGNH